ncbi:MAG: 3-oxoacyl-ACP reductase FabG [Bacillota bacterium]|nr:3-oxoacyl-ACP reductase FabG [Bacillota bacterium]
MDRLKGKIALVTGGAQGIGREICLAFLREGAELVISADMQLGEELPNLRQVQLNVTNREEIAEFVANLKEELGRIDVLVNNAGITRDALLEKMKPEMWNLVLDVNLTGVFNMTQAIAPVMMANGKGSIINISSAAGVYGNIGQSNYAATKAGVVGLTYTWAKELPRKGADIRTNAIAPGLIMTDMMKTVPDKVLEPIREKTPLKRLGTPQEIANTALFLASDESSFINGQVLSVDGGLRL